MLWKIVSGGSAAGLFIALVLAVTRLASLEERERVVARTVTLAEQAQSEPLEGGGAQLAEAGLYRGQRVVFEVCANDPMESERWLNAFDLAIRRAGGSETMTRSPLSEETLGFVRRDVDHACLTVGSGGVGADDDYTVDALWGERGLPAGLADVELTIRIVARPELLPQDTFTVVAIWLGSFGLLLGLILRRASTRDAADPAAEAAQQAWEEAVHGGPRRQLPDWARVGIGLVAVVSAFVVSGFLPGGAALALATGVGLALGEVAIGSGLAPARGLASRLEILGLCVPAGSRRWYLWLPAALLAGVALVLIASYATRLVPSTGTSVIQTVVSWPSGLLSFAALGVFAPLAEEIFFRGFVYGTLEQRSRGLAFAGGWLLFVVAHLPQTYGQWGALVGILITGLALTGLRAASRTTLVPAVAHLVYNGLLALSGLLT